MVTPEVSAPIPATDPFTALAAHFGMLLGVSDLEAVVGHAWAKMRLHNSWQHGEGVTWGFPVTVDTTTREVRVGAGLGHDSLGHELSLPATYCLDLAAWREQHEADLPTPGQPFDAHVVARFRACLARPVPAVVSSCEGAEADTAYSRLAETVELFLLPGKAARPPDRYPRLRAFLGLGAPHPAADTERGKVAVAVPQERTAAWLTAIRTLAAADGIDRKPVGGGHFPGPDPDPDHPETGSLVLANLIGLRLTQTDPPTASVTDIDYSVRPSHVDTTTLLELAVRGDADAGGPRVRSVRTAGKVIHVEMTRDVVPATLSASVRAYAQATGWTNVAVANIGYTRPDITIELTTAPADGTRLRIVLPGTGPTPIAADDGGVPVALAGLVGGAPADRDEGRDAVLGLVFPKEA